MNGTATAFESQPNGDARPKWRAANGVVAAVATAEVSTTRRSVLPTARTRPAGTAPGASWIRVLHTSAAQAAKDSWAPGSNRAPGAATRSAAAARTSAWPEGSGRRRAAASTSAASNRSARRTGTPRPVSAA